MIRTSMHLHTPVRTLYHYCIECRESREWIESNLLEFSPNHLVDDANV